MAAPPRCVDGPDREETPDSTLGEFPDAMLSFSYKFPCCESASTGLRPEGLEAAMRRVLHFKGRPRVPSQDGRSGPPLFCVCVSVKDRASLFQNRHPELVSGPISPPGAE